VIHLTLYTRRGCFLCDKMKAVVRAVAADVPLRLEEVDIDTSQELAARYGHDIPVLLVEGEEIARHRVTTDDLRTLLGRRRAGRPPT
jgi:glutaredoxin